MNPRYYTRQKDAKAKDRPGEQQWRVHKKATGNSIYENTEEMQESLRTHA